MSIHREGGRWRVKYRVGGRQRSRTFDRKGDANAFDAEMKRRRQLGPVLAAELDRTTLTLAEYVRGPWRSHATTLSSASRARYAWALEKHLADLLNEPLLALDVAILGRHQSLLLSRGATASTVRAVMTCLSGILQIAIEQGYLTVNAARMVRKVRAEPRAEVAPLTPVELERLITSLHGRNRAIALLAGQLGLRPKEVRAIPWSALTDTHLVIGKAQTKLTAMWTRTIAVPALTARELKEWRLRSGRPSSDEPIIGPMSPNAVRLWNRQVLRPAVSAATQSRITGATLYTLRHSHASALHYCGFTVPEAARRLGHDAALHLKTYAHVLEAISGERYTDLDAMLSAARSEAGVPPEFRKVKHAASQR